MGLSIFLKETVLDKFYTTKKLIGNRRAQLWRQFICETFVELDCGSMSTENFFGELRARSVGDLGISTITTDGYDVFRTNKGIKKSSNDAFIVSVQTAGTSTIRQLGREVTLNPGDFTIYDSTMPYHLHFENRLSQLVVKIPRNDLKKYMDTPESLTALHVKGGDGIAQITTNFAQNLFNQSENLSTNMQHQVADTFLSLLTTSLREATSERELAPRNKATQLFRVKQYISQNLRDPLLSLKVIADEHRISERYLHTLFSNEGITPSRFIWEQRLQSAQTDLANSLLAHRSISEICFAWAFSDTAHFSRAFKKKFGVSPRAFRKTHFQS